MTFMQTLISSIVDGITALISPIAQAIQEGFNAFLYVDPSASEKVVSDLAVFLFTMLGISIGVGLVWLAISLFRGRGRVRT